MVDVESLLHCPMPDRPLLEGQSRHDHEERKWLEGLHRDGQRPCACNVTCGDVTDDPDPSVVCKGLPSEDEPLLRAQRGRHEHATLEEELSILKRYDGCWAWRARIGSKVNSRLTESRALAWDEAVAWMVLARREAGATDA